MSPPPHHSPSLSPPSQLTLHFPFSKSIQHCPISPLKQQELMRKFAQRVHIKRSLPLVVPCSYVQPNESAKRGGRNLSLPQPPRAKWPAPKSCAEAPCAGDRLGKTLDFKGGRDERTTWRLPGGVSGVGGVNQQQCNDNN